MALLSMLAVLLGSPPPTPESSTRASAGNVAPVLPELRAAPQPLPGLSGLMPTPPDPFRPPRLPPALAMVMGHWQAPIFTPDLALLGRRQTDGG